MRCLALLCVVSLSFSLPAEDVDRAREWRVQATQLYHEGHFLGALRSYGNAVKLDPSLGSFTELRSLIETRGLSEEDKAMVIELALEMTREYAAAHKDEWAPVALIAKLAEPDVAEKALTEWLSSNPDDPVALVARAEVRAAQKRYDAVVEDWEKLIALDPNNFWRHFEIASTMVDALLEDKTSDRAALERAIARTEKALRRTAELDPQFGPAPHHLSGLLDLRSRMSDDAPEKLRLDSEAAAARSAGMKLMRKSMASLYSGAILSVTQGQRTFIIDDRDVLHLDRAPFTIELKAENTGPLLLNIDDDDALHRAIWPGYRLSQGCTPPSRKPFCPQNMVAERAQNQEQRLIVSASSSHKLFFKSATDHAWSEATGDKVRSFKRVVSRIGDAPIAATKMKALYFTAVNDFDSNGVVGPFELDRFTLKFKK